jgi:cytochrome P450
MTGGTETMSTLLAGLTFNLCKNPEKLQRLVREIRSFGSSDEFTMVNLSGLQYLNACIQESLRLYPPVPEGLPRIVPNGGVKICDVFVPAGVSFMTHINAAAYCPC